MTSDSSANFNLDTRAPLRYTLCLPVHRASTRTYPRSHGTGVDQSRPANPFPLFFLSPCGVCSVPRGVLSRDGPPLSRPVFLSGAKPVTSAETGARSQLTPIDEIDRQGSESEESGFGKEERRETRRRSSRVAVAGSWRSVPSRWKPDGS